MFNVNKGWSDWDYEREDYSYDKKKAEVVCYHKWKAILLLNLTAYDCEYCGEKKENVESGDKYTRIGDY